MSIDYEAISQAYGVSPEVVELIGKALRGPAPEGTLRDKIGQAINDELFKLGYINAYPDTKEIDRIADAVIVALCFPPDTPGDAFIKPLRDLRMWHWTKVTQSRAQERAHEAHAAQWLVRDVGGVGKMYNKRHLIKAKLYKKTADFHLTAVQALNNAVPGTAEQDCAVQ